MTTWADRQQRRRRGECIVCARPAQSNSTRCELCLQVNRLRQRQRERERRAMGLCPRCGLARAPDSVLCDLHAEYMREYSRRYRLKVPRRRWRAKVGM